MSPETATVCSLRPRTVWDAAPLDPPLKGSIGIRSTVIFLGDVSLVLFPRRQGRTPSALGVDGSLALYDS